MKSWFNATYLVYIHTHTRARARRNKLTRSNSVAYRGVLHETIEPSVSSAVKKKENRIFLHSERPNNVPEAEIARSLRCHDKRIETTRINSPSFSRRRVFSSLWPSRNEVSPLEISAQIRSKLFAFDFRVIFNGLCDSVTQRA